MGLQPMMPANGTSGAHVYFNSQVSRQFPRFCRSNSFSPNWFSRLPATFALAHWPETGFWDMRAAGSPEYHDGLEPDFRGQGLHFYE
jgi:hypothetical protein